MSRRFIASTMPIMMRILDRFQYLHPQYREVLHHVTYESVDWMTAFNFYLVIGNLFDWLNNWLDDPSSVSQVPITGPDGRDDNRKREGVGEQGEEGEEDVGGIDNSYAYSGTSYQKTDYELNSQENKNENHTNIDGIAGAGSIDYVSQALRKEFPTAYSIPDNGDVDDNFWKSAGQTEGRMNRENWEEFDIGNENYNIWDTKVLPSLTTVLRTALKGVIDWQARSIPPGFDPHYDLGLRTPVKLYIPPLPVMFSFHLPLHRFFASVIGEGCKFPMHAPALLELQHQLGALTRDTYGNEKGRRKGMGRERRQNADGHLKSTNDQNDHNNTSSSSSSSGKNVGCTGESASSSIETDTVSYHLSSLVDYPLRSSLFGSQIRVGMWRKNGSGMTDQLLNYLDIPYCKVFRDLDVLMVQFCVSTYGAKRLICHILYRYGVLIHLLNVNTNSSVEDTMKGEKNDINNGSQNPYLSSGEVLYDPSPPLPRPPHPPSSLQPSQLPTPSPSPSPSFALSHLPLSAPAFSIDDSQFSSPLVEEALLLIINIVTEIPPPPSSDLLQQSELAVRKEIIHFLAGKTSNVSTFSQLQDHVSSCNSEFAKISPLVLEQIINEVADKKKSSVLEPPFFVLKKEMWLHYDSSFSHITFKMHQTAIEKKPKNLVPSPLCPPLQQCHPLFSTLRCDMLFEPHLLQCLRNLLYAATASKTIHNTYAPVRTWDLKCGGVELNRAIHLLTVCMHYLADLTLQKRGQGQGQGQEKANDATVSLADTLPLHTPESHTTSPPNPSTAKNDDTITARMVAYLLEETVVTVPETSGDSMAEVNMDCPGPSRTHRLPHVLWYVRFKFKLPVSYVFNDFWLTFLLMTCHVISCHVTCHVMSHHVISCHVMTYHIMSCYVISYYVISCYVMSYHVMSCHIMLCHVILCHVMSYYVMSCHVMSCHVILCHVMSCHVMSCHVMS